MLGVTVSWRFVRERVLSKSGDVVPNRFGGGSILKISKGIVVRSIVKVTALPKKNEERLDGDTLHITWDDCVEYGINGIQRGGDFAQRTWFTAPSLTNKRNETTGRNGNYHTLEPRLLKKQEREASIRTNR